MTKYALVILAFAAAPERMSLNLAVERNSLAHHAKGTPSALSQKLGHRPSTACRRLVSGSISLPSSGFFSPFPHGTSSLSVINEYLALEGGPSRFRPGFPCPVLLRCRHGCDAAQKAATPFRIRGYHPVSLSFPEHSAKVPQHLFADPTTPRQKCRGLGCSRFARRYSGNLI